MSQSLSLTKRVKIDLEGKRQRLFCHCQVCMIDTEQASCRGSREQCFSHSRTIAVKGLKGPLLKWFLLSYCWHSQTCFTLTIFYWGSLIAGLPPLHHNPYFTPISPILTSNLNESRTALCFPYPPLFLQWVQILLQVIPVFFFSASSCGFSSAIPCCSGAANLILVVCGLLVCPCSW